MPALQLGGSSSSSGGINIGKDPQGFGLQNGFGKQAGSSQQDAETLLLAKKKELLDEQQEPEVNNNNNNAGQTEEKFSDLRTIGINGKCSSEQEEPCIFTGDHEIETSIGRSAKDQFADALLRLQSDLHNNTERLSELANKVEKINLSSSRGGRMQQQQNNKSSPVLNRDNITTLFYFSWPVMVFLAIRAYERRSLSSK